MSVVLSEAKDLMGTEEILRCAQDDTPINVAEERRSARDGARKPCSD